FKNDEGEVETVAGSATNELTNVQKLFDRYILSDDIREGGIYTDAVYITGIGTGNDTNIAPADESEIFGQGAGIGQYGVTAKVSSSIDQLTGNLDALKAKFASAQPNTV
ncbi:DUF2235 domain-containing protein, partial [Vibrio anguillarum]|nr:DUF2235 domain-containing protein [Vibrio anguillarum]